MIRYKDMREDNDLKQKDIAKLLNTTREQYSKYENGIRYLPIKHLITLTKFYNTSADYLLGLTNEITPYKVNNTNTLRLKELRIKENLHQKDIAKLLMTTQEQYSKYETGVRSIPVYHLETLSNYYNTNIALVKRKC